MVLNVFLIFFGLKKLKKPPQKVANLSRNSVVSEIFHLLPNECPTAQMAEFMFQNVVYRATVYRTGTVTKGQIQKRIVSAETIRGNTVINQLKCALPYLFYQRCVFCFLSFF